MTTVSCDPQVVGVQNASLSLSMQFPQDIPARGMVKITLPPEVSIAQGTLTSVCEIIEDQTSLGTDGSKYNCSATGQDITIILGATKQFTAFSMYSLTINNKFNTPNSTASTSSFKIFTFSDSKGFQPLDSQQTNVFVTVTANMLRAASITQSASSPLQVGALTQAVVSITLQTALQANSSVQIKFPKLNRDAPTSQQKAMILISALKCTKNPNSTVVNNVLNCSFTNDILTIPNIINQTAPFGSVLSFFIDGIYNPYNFTALIINVKTMTPNQIATVDEKTMTFLTRTSTDLTTSKVTASNETVQEYATFNIEVQNPIPIFSGTIFTVVFPSDDFTFDSRLTTVQGFGLFGSLRTLKFVSDTSQRSIKILNGIDSYRQAQITGKIIIELVRNPSTIKPTGTFKIYIQDKNEEVLARIESGVTYQSTAGQLQGVQASASAFFINYMNDITLTIALNHKLSAQNSKLRFTLPTNIRTDSASVEPITESSNQLSASFTCTRLTISQFECSKLFQSTFQGSGSIQIIVRNVQNPLSTQLINGLQLQTYDNGYLVDTLTDNNIVLLTTLPNTFTAVTVTPSSNVTYTTINFNFAITLADPVPSDGILQVWIPSEIQPSSQVGCNGISGMKVGSISCGLLTSSGGLKQIQMINPFQGVTTVAGQSIKFSLSNMRGPLSTRTTSSFKIYSMDKQMYLINEVESLILVTMTQGADIGAFKVISSSDNVASLTNISLTFSSPVPVRSSDLIVITFPQDVIPPDRNRIQCAGDGKQLTTNLKCTVNDQIVTIQASPVSTNGIAVYTQFNIKISGAVNPGSTKPTGNFQVEIMEKEGYLMAQSQDGGTFTVGTPGLLTNGSITTGDPRPFAVTTITFQFTTATDIPVNGLLQFDFDQIYFKFPDDKSIITCSTNLVQNARCDFTPSSRIIVRDLFPLQPLLAGSTLTFTIDNCQLDVDRRMVTDSWIINTLTEDGYTIDRLTNGLSLNFTCNSPCLACADTNPNFCFSCNPLAGSPILYNTRCYSVCPMGLYLTEFGQCMPCNAKCRTCKSDNPNYCLTCDNSTENKYLDGNTCQSECQQGWFANIGNGKCDKCDGTCLSCDKNSSQCQSCNTTSNFKYFYQNKCLTQCPSGFTFDQSTLVCIKCDPNCLECSTLPSICTACNSSRVLSLLDRTCVAQCPADLTVFDVKAIVCRACDPRCQTCKGKISFCTSCPNGLSLQPTDGTCVGTCSIDNTQVSVNFTCVNCSQSCATCINRPDSCLTCKKTIPYLHDDKCLIECPVGYEPSDENQCVITGLRCPFGHEINKQGNGCILKSQICEDGYKLNSAKDRCIPGPGKYVPFPLLILSLILALPVIYSRLKHKETKFITCMVIILSLLETIGIYVQLIHSYSMGIFSTFGLTMVAACFLYGSNLFFCIIFMKQVYKTDNSFKYWVKNYKKPVKTILYLSGTLNFKLFRMLYCNFLGKQQFLAPFDEASTFFRPFTLISTFSIITTMVPLIIASICGLVFMELGYQLTMTNIEMVIIELLLLVLILVEKNQLRKTVMKEEKYYKVEPKLLDSQYVMSAFNDQSQITNITTLKTQVDGPHQGGMSDYYQRRKHLENLINTITYSKIQPTKNSSRGLQSTTMDHIQELQKEEKFNFKRRRCISAIDIPIKDDQYDKSKLKQGKVETFWDLGNDPDLQNFISLPVSPREKEMLQNPRFAGSVVAFKRAVRERDQFDNCYAEGKPSYMFGFRDCELKQVKTQTSMIELLALEDMIDMKLRQHLLMRGFEEESPRILNEESEIPTASITQTLIQNVIQSIPPDLTAPRPILPLNRVKQIPKFTLEQIRGSFEKISGQNLLMKTAKTGVYADSKGKRVNLLGYLVDVGRNIVNKQGVIIFKSEDLASDGDLPEPFYSQKVVQKLKIVIESDSGYLERVKLKRKEEGRDYKVDLSQDSEDDVAVDKVTPFRSRMGLSGRLSSSSNGILGENNLQWKSSQASRATTYIRQSMDLKSQQTQLIEEEQEVIDIMDMDKILKPMQAKSRQELMYTKLSKPPLIPNIQSGFRKTRNLFDQETPTSQQYTHPLKTSSIGIFDNTATSINDDLLLRENDIPQQNFDFGHSNNTIFKKSDYLIDDRASQLNKMKTLLDGTSNEDIALLKQIEQYQSQINPIFKDAIQVSGKLAMRNLAKVYGKTQIKSKLGGKKSERWDQYAEEEITFKNAPITNLKEQKKPNLNPIGNLMGGDSRLKNLESIYGKQQAQTSHGFYPATMNKPHTASTQEMRKRSHFITNGSSIIDFQSQSSLEDDTLEEKRFRKELDQMQAMLDKEKKIASQVNKRAKRQGRGGGRQLIDGGWI